MINHPWIVIPTLTGLLISRLLVIMSANKSGNIFWRDEETAILLFILHHQTCLQWCHKQVRIVHILTTCICLICIRVSQDEFSLYYVTMLLWYSPTCKKRLNEKISQIILIFTRIKPSSKPKWRYAKDVATSLGFTFYKIGSSRVWWRLSKYRRCLSLIIIYEKYANQRDFVHWPIQ